jgi:hypothetical protein
VPRICPLCGSADIGTVPYLRLNSKSHVRNIAYALPGAVALTVERFSERFRRLYRPVKVNKAWFAKRMHVHDILAVFDRLVAKRKPGGYLFLEPPNIANWEVLRAMPHTPHTWMLSAESFRRLAAKFDLQTLAIEEVGPPWRRSYPRLRCDVRADLRVLMRKPTSQMTGWRYAGQVVVHQ